MRRAAITLTEAQSFDRVAKAYDRLGDLNPNELTDSWLEGLLPAAGGRSISAAEPGGVRRPRPNITYCQADLHDVDSPAVAGPSRH